MILCNLCVDVNFEKIDSISADSPWQRVCTQQFLTLTGKLGPFLVFHRWNICREKKPLCLSDNDIILLPLAYEGQEMLIPC